MAVTLAWDRSTDPSVTGYRLHYGTSKGSYTTVLDVGNSTSAALPDLPVGGTYFFVVTARNAASVESAPSNEVSHTVRGSVAPANASLASLTVSTGSLNPNFASGTTAYTLTVPNSTGSVTVTPRVADSAATVKVAGSAVSSGSASGPISLAVGSNSITTVVTAGNGATIKSYTLTVTRSPAPAPPANTAVATAQGGQNPPAAPARQTSIAPGQRPAFAGSYVGLLEATAGSQTPRDHEGLVRIGVLRTGAFTGSVKLGGLTIPFRGMVLNDGRLAFGRGLTSLELVRKGKLANTSLGQLKLTLDTAPGADRITGSLTQGATTVAELAHADRALLTAKKNPVLPYKNVPRALADPLGNQGRYTALFYHADAPNNGLPADRFPQGDGWARLTVGASGNVNVVGKLADGTLVSYGAPLSKTYKLPVYVPLYSSRRGFLSGRVTFNPAQRDTDASAPGMKWFKPANAKDSLYPAGWPRGIKVDFAASKFVAPSKPSRTTPSPLLVLGRDNVLGLGASRTPAPVKLVFADGGTAGFFKAATVNARNEVTVTVPGKTLDLAAKLTADGTLRGSFNHPASKKTVTYQGVVYQKMHTAGGYFLHVPPKAARGPASGGLSGSVGIAP
jgi:hypothetical protein